MLCYLTMEHRLTISDTLFPVYNDKAEILLGVLLDSI